MKLGEFNLFLFVSASFFFTNCLTIRQIRQTRVTASRASYFKEFLLISLLTLTWIDMVLVLATAQASVDWTSICWILWSWTASEALVLVGRNIGQNIPKTQKKIEMFSFHEFQETCTWVYGSLVSSVNYSEKSGTTLLGWRDHYQ